MPSITQGMTQRLENFTHQLNDSEQNSVLRLHNGKIVKGEYKGTRLGRFFHWSTQLFRTRKQRLVRKTYLQKITNNESRALAEELCKDISKRTPVPYQVNSGLQRIRVQDAKKILKRTQTERDKFSQVVNEVVASAATPNPLRTDVVDSAGDRVYQSLMDRTIRRQEQLKQLEHEVIETLDHKRNHRKPGESFLPSLKGSKYKQLKQRFSQKIGDKLLTLALFREAEEYATKQALTNLRDISKTSSVEQSAVSLEDQRKLVNSFVNSDHESHRANKSIAQLTAEYMLKHGFEVDEADLPDLSQEGVQGQLEAEINELSGTDSYWAQEIAHLLRENKFKEAHIVRELAKDSGSIELLDSLREKVADDKWDNYQAGQQKKLKAGKKLKGRGPKLSKESSQNVFDRVRPWRGGLSRIATAFAKQAISKPVERDGDGSTQEKHEMIEQTLNMMKAKYKSFSEQHNAAMMTQLREYLEKNLQDRHVEIVHGMKFIDPLSKPEPAEPYFDVTLATEDDDDDEPVFDKDKMAFKDSDSDYSSASTITGDELPETEKLIDDNVFEEEPPAPKTGPDDLGGAIEQTKADIKRVNSVFGRSNADKPAPSARSQSFSEGTSIPSKKDAD